MPSALLDRSGSVFYSGRSAFGRAGKLYVLGLNPGGSPAGQASETIGRSIADWRQGPRRWSAYKDESWRGAPPGTWGMQPRILHLFDGLSLDPCAVPASNVLFVRSSDEATLPDKSELLQQCWPVHRSVIESLDIRTIVCLGGTAGRSVRSLIGADRLVARFVERNGRRWANEAHVGSGGLCVVTLTHPGRADWRNPAADPTPLVREMLTR